MKNKNIRVVSPQYRRVLLPDFSGGFRGSRDEALLGLADASDCCNFNISSGALTDGYGVSAYGLPHELDGKITSVFSFEKTDGAQPQSFLMVCADGDIFYREKRVADFTRLAGVRFTSPPSAVCYRLFGADVVLMLSATDSMAVWDGVSPAYTVENAPPAKSAALHFERMFVCSEKDSGVWFSDDLDPTNWNPSLDEGGFIQLLDERGAPRKAVSFLNYLYVFRERGISRLSAYGDQTEFTVSNLFVSADRIYEDTVQVCGDSVVFCAGDGLYRFDGLSTSRLLPKLSGRLLPSAGALAVYSAGKYYLSCRTRVKGEQKDALFVLDLADGSYSFTVPESRCERLCTVLTEGGAAVLALCSGRAGRVEKGGLFFGTPLKKVWQSGLIDLGLADSYKLVKELYVLTDGPADIEVRTESGQKSFAVSGSPLTQRLRVNLMGRRLALRIASETENARILRPSIRMAVMKKL